MVKFYPSYTEIQTLSQTLARQLSNNNYDAIVAIGGGGLIPGRMMRTILNVPVLVLTVESYCGQEQEECKIVQWVDKCMITGQKILLVDELRDTGKTLNFVCRKLLQWEPNQLDVAVLHDKEKEKVALPKEINFYCGMKWPDEWIVYPWET